MALDHGELVGAWIEHATAGLAPEEEVALFERALAALWHRARKTLGELTLAAIVDRVLTTAAVKHPLLVGLGMEGDRFKDAELALHASKIPDGQMRAAFRDVLTDWLTVVGNLTAEILTPVLHEALKSVGASDPAIPDEEKS